MSNMLHDLLAIGGVLLTAMVLALIIGALVVLGAPEEE